MLKHIALPTFASLPAVRYFWTILEWTADAAAGRLLASLGAAPPVNADGDRADDLLMQREYLAPEVPEGEVFVIEEV